MNPMIEVYDIYFELSNEDRMSILQTLLEEQLNLTGLSTSLGLKNQEVSRHLSRLESSGFVRKNTDGTYAVTHFGKLCLIKNDEMEFIVTHLEYFNNHSVEKIPRELVAKIGVLSNSTFINDTLIALQIVKRIFDESDEYLFRLSNQFLMILLDQVVSAADRGVIYSFIYSSDITVPPNASDTVRLRDASHKGTFFSYTHPDVKAFMVMSEKEVMLAFPELDGKYDYTGFNSTDKDVLKWCKELYELHETDRLPPLPLWSDIP